MSYNTPQRLALCESYGFLVSTSNRPVVLLWMTLTLLLASKASLLSIYFKYLKYYTINELFSSIILCVYP